MSSCKNIFLCFVLLILQVAVNEVRAQKKNRSTMEPGTMLVRFNFPGVVDPLETNLSGGLEYKKTEQLSYTADLGYVYFSSIMGDVKRTNGLIFRTAIRYYSKNTPQLFGELELHNKLVYYRMHDWLGINAVNGVPSYEEFKYFNYAKYVGGVNIKTGYQGRLSKDKRWWMEVYMGFGVKYRNYYLSGQPGGTVYNSVNNNGFFWGNNRAAGGGGMVLPNLSLGMRLLYRLPSPSQVAILP